MLNFVWMCLIGLVAGCGPQIFRHTLRGLLLQPIFVM